MPFTAPKSCTLATAPLKCSCSTARPRGSCAAIGWVWGKPASWDDNDRWRCIDKPSLKHKGPHRYGSIKEELKHRFLFVYGTRRTAEENGWACAKARYDAETFWYRGNGSVDIVEDTAGGVAPIREPS
mgnify:CR=1 FL=1